MIITLHGRDSSPYGELWHNRCLKLREAFPNSTVIALRGPLKGKTEKKNLSILGCVAINKFSWLNIDTKTSLVVQFAKHALHRLKIVDQINQFIENRLGEYKLDASRVAIIGGSEGGIAGIQAALHSKKPYGAVLGMAITVPAFSKCSVSPGPIIDLFIGDKDEVFNRHVKEAKGVFNRVASKLSHDNMSNTVNRLRAIGVRCTQTICLKTKHVITSEMWNSGINCVSDRLRIKNQLQ